MVRMNGMLYGVISARENRSWGCVHTRTRTCARLRACAYISLTAHRIPSVRTMPRACSLSAGGLLKLVGRGLAWVGALVAHELKSGEPCPRVFLQLIGDELPPATVRIDDLLDFRI